MKLLIDNKYEDEFLNILIKQIQDYILKHVNTKKLKNVDDFLDIVGTKSIYLKHIKAISIINVGIRNLEFIKYPTKIIIQINPNVNFYGSNYKVEELCKLINNGNLTLQGYPIFSDTFKFFKNHVDEYYKLYQNGIIK